MCALSGSLTPPFTDPHKEFLSQASVFSLPEIRVFSRYTSVPGLIKAFGRLSCLGQVASPLCFFPVYGFLFELEGIPSEKALESRQITALPLSSSNAVLLVTWTTGHGS